MSVCYGCANSCANCNQVIVASTTTGSILFYGCGNTCPMTNSLCATRLARALETGTKHMIAGTHPSRIAFLNKSRFQYGKVYKTSNSGNKPSKSCSSCNKN